MTGFPEKLRSDIETLWDYNHLGHTLRRTDLALGLGSHDPGVPTYTAELYHAGYFPLVVFSGANAPTTVERFPRGEAVHFRELAIQAGVPGDVVLVEPYARSTVENVDLTRQLIEGKGAEVRAVLIICRPYQQRRAWGIMRQRWPEVTAICASEPLSLDDYITTIGDPDLVVNMLVGDTHRIRSDAEAGIAVAQEIPPAVQDAYERLASAGYTKRLPLAGHYDATR